MAMRDSEFLVYPSRVKLYLQCPAQYEYKYEKRIKGVHPANHTLIKGNALHHLMGRVMRQVKAGRTVPPDIYPWAESVTSGLDYPAEFSKLRREDAQDISRWSGWALAQIGDGARVVDVERDRYRTLQRAVRGRPITLRSRLDAVVKHVDGSVEHIDYKTGKVRTDPVQDLISRTVVGAAYGGDRRIVTTTLFVAHKRRESRELKPDEVRPVWEDVKRAITAIATGEGPWDPTPTPLCEWCPYCDICPAYK